MILRQGFALFQFEPISNDIDPFKTNSYDTHKLEHPENHKSEFDIVNPLRT